MSLNFLSIGVPLACLWASHSIGVPAGLERLWGQIPWEGTREYSIEKKVGEGIPYSPLAEKVYWFFQMSEDRFDSRTLYESNNNHLPLHCTQNNKVLCLGFGWLIKPSGLALCGLVPAQYSI